MLKRLFATALLLACVGPAVGADPIVQPLTKSGDQMGVLMTLTRVVPVIREITVNVNGVNQVQKVTVAVPETITQFTPVNETVGTFYNVEGQAIDAKMLKALLVEKVKVALVYDGELPKADARKELAERKVELIVVMKVQKKEMPIAPPIAPKVAPAVPPPAQPPFFVSPAVLKDDTLTVVQTVTVYEQVQVKEKVKTFDGKDVEVTVLKMVPVQKQMQIVFAVKDLQFQSLDGKKIDAKELPKLLKDKAQIVIGSVNAPPTADQLKTVKDVVLVALRPAPENKQLLPPMPPKP